MMGIFDDDDDGTDNGYDHHADVVTVEIRGDRAYVTIETDEGEVVHPQSKGGFSAEQLDDLWNDYGADMWDYVLDELWDSMYEG